jgi:hypothetical protein
VPAAQKPFVLATRLGLILLFLTIAYLVRRAWYNKKAVGQLE